MRRIDSVFFKGRKLSFSKNKKTYLNRSSYVLIVGVIALSAAQPTYLMGIFNMINPPKVAPLYSKLLPQSQPQEIGSFSPVDLDSPTMDLRDRAVAEKEQDTERNRLHELVDMRTANTSTYLNEDGTKTMEFSTTQQNFKENGQWKKIDNKLEAFNESGKFGFRAEAGNAGASLPSLQDGISLIGGSDSIIVKPVGAQDIQPEKVGDHIVVYKDAWPGVDLKYEIRGEMIKEYTIIKNKDANTSFDYTVIGGKVITDPATKGALAVEGVEGYHFSPLSLEVNGKGVITEERVAQHPTENGLRVSLDKGWLDSQPNSAFPMTIDPSWTSSDPSTTYKMYKSDGYYCPSTSCFANTGSINDGSAWRHWRTYINFPYSALDNKRIISATMNGTFQSGADGTTAGKTIYMGEASCSTGFSCFGAQVATDAGVSTNFGIDFKTKLQSLINANDFSTWWSFRGEEGSAKSFKPYYMIRASVTYDTATPMASATTAIPADKAVVTHTQPSLKVNAVTDPDSADVEQYYFRVATGKDAETGAVINSGWITANQWTIPEHILQDGTTYYWHVYTRGNASTPHTSPNWTRSFKIDLRTGKDSTQAYDSVGPVDVDLATGNLTTSVQSHSINALGGDIGLNLDYNTPALSRPGLKGEYFDQNSLAGPIFVTRNDPNINFDWGTGSPDPSIDSDTFSVRWTGYLTPSVTGNYKLGCSASDSCRILINDVEQYHRGVSGEGYQSTSIHLEAGVPYKFEARTSEGSADASVAIKIDNGISTQVIPESWFSTEPQSIAQEYGLTGKYYNDPTGSYTFPSNLNDPNRLVMVRQDNKINFNWASGSPSPGLPADKFLASWRGYLSVPENGNYKVGAWADDRVRIKLGIGLFGADQTVLNSWTSVTGANLWSGNVSLTAGQKIPITIEYAEQTGSAEFALLVETPSSLQQEMPVTWLTPDANILPNGWDMSVGAGDIRFERLQMKSDAAILSDSSGQKYEFKYNPVDKIYIPPVGEETILVANHNGTYNLSDVDGSTYLFDAEGRMTSYVGPQDDRQPAALKYEYTNNPSRLNKIVDGVDSSRYGQLYYSGSTECVTGSGFDAAPSGMLCAFATTDGDETYFQYKNGALARVVTPGDAYEDFQYDSTYGRLTAYRDSLTNDAISYGVRSNNNEALTEIAYDELGRTKSVTAPAPDINAGRMEHTFNYVDQVSTESDTGATETHITGATEPAGFMQRIEYDDKFRTTKDIDSAGLATVTEWHADKDLVLSTTDPLGLKSTTIYDDDDIPTNEYGAAPASWFGADRKPLSQYQSEVPHTEAKYDEGINGLAASYMSVKERAASILGVNKELHKGDYLMSTDQRFKLAYQTDGNVVLYGPTGSVLWHNNKDGIASTRLKMQSDGNLVLYNGATAVWNTGTNGNGSSTLWVQTDGNLVIYDSSKNATWNTGTSEGSHGIGQTSLLGVPLLNDTGIGANPTKISNTWTTSPISSGSNYWGIRMTGKMYLPTTGNWNFKITSDNGVRMVIDDTVVINDWIDNSTVKIHPTYTFNNIEANKPHRVTIDYYHIPGTANNTSDASFSLLITPPGGIETDNVAQYFKPNYKLITSEKVFDSVLGATETQTEYANPAYGTVLKTAIDPSGMGIENRASYEEPGTGYLRQTSRVMPNGSEYLYVYYGATEAVDNPCTIESDAVSQSGRIKLLRSPDPDGSGTEVGRTLETVYDAAGRATATRFNNDLWTCIDYDVRGRVVETKIPALGNKPSRTITKDYVVDGNPLKTSTSDNTGVIVVESDLVGRTVKYTDTKGKVTTNTYDIYNRLISRISPLGQEEYEYDQYDRLHVYKLDSVIFATVTYDQFGNISEVSYPAGIKLDELQRDSLGRTNKAIYSVGNQTISDEVTRSVSGNILSGTENGIAKNYNYDKAGRLVGATIGDDVFNYEFDTSDPECASLPGNNTMAGKNSNRTKYTLNGQSTTYCYDMADRLLSSTDARFTNVEYDDHGNVIKLGDTTHKTEFNYDSSDRSSSIIETYSGSTEKEIEYERDVQDRLLRRHYAIDGITKSDNYYGYTGEGDSPAFLTDFNGTVTQKYITLPGGVNLTIKPQVVSAGAATYSLSNIHGDTMATVNADGLVTPTPITGPYGELLVQSSQPSSTVDGASWNYLGRFKKTTDTDFAIFPTQMGARIYIAELGRFLQVDPVEGGTLNDYVYAVDPVNQYDLNGEWLQHITKAFNAIKSAYNATKPLLTKAINTVSRLVKSANVRSKPAPVIKSLPPKQAPKHVQSTVKHLKANNFKSTPKGQRGGALYKNTNKVLPQRTSQGAKVKYREYDVHAKVKGVSRGEERLVVGNDRSVYYTRDHYDTFVQIEKADPFSLPMW